MIFDYDHPETWPADVVYFLDNHRAVLNDWLGAQCFASPYQYDEIIRELFAVLRNHEILAWHSTRLTEREITRIVAEGMELPTVGDTDAADRCSGGAGRISAGDREAVQAPAPGGLVDAARANLVSVHTPAP
jgi:hypothetical protein